MARLLATSWGLRAAGALMIALLLALASAPGARAASSASIAWVGLDSNIYYCGANCAKPRCITCPVKGLHARAGGGVIDAGLWPVQHAEPQLVDYSFPTFSPDGKFLAYTWRGHREGEPAAGVSVYDLANREETIVFKSRGDTPIYLYWQPDGRHLSFLLAGAGGRLTLMVAETKKGAPVRIVASGAPLFFDWNRTATEVAIHSREAAGVERVVLMSLSESDQKVERVLGSGYAPFETPSWSPDGRHLAWVGADKSGAAALYVAGTDGSSPRALVKLTDGIASFIWTPDSQHIAYSVARHPPRLVYSGISLVDVSDGATRRLTRDDVLAYFISPDSRHIAYISVPAEMPFYTWKVINLAGGGARSLGNFLATQPESEAYRYFAQLALSHTIWSPDSRAFVYAGVHLIGAPAYSLGVAPPPRVIVVPIDGSKQHYLGKGTVAFWSPAP